MDANDAVVYDTSDDPFTVKGRVQLDSPNGGNILTVATPFNVNGSVFGPIAQVKLFYSTNGGATYENPMNGCETVAVSGGSFSCNWSVPDIIGTTVRVKVEDANNSLVNDASAANFSVKGSASLIAPTTGNIWIAGTSNNIVWDRTGTIGNVDLLYSVNNGTYNSIASGVPSPTVTGNSYPWTLPSDAIVSPNVKVKITGENLVNEAVSPAFTVKGSLALTYPTAAGITRVLGDTMNVTWSVAVLVIVFHAVPSK